MAAAPVQHPSVLVVDDDEARETVASILRHLGYPVATAANGDIFVSDGYRNSRVHKFSPDGRLLKSWGEPGNARDLRNSTNSPGLFHTPHGIFKIHSLSHSETFARLFAFLQP